MRRACGVSTFTVTLQPDLKPHQGYFKQFHALSSDSEGRLTLEISSFICIICRIREFSFELDSSSCLPSSDVVELDPISSGLGGKSRNGKERENYSLCIRVDWIGEGRRLDRAKGIVVDSVSSFSSLEGGGKKAAGKPDRGWNGCECPYVPETNNEAAVRSTIKPDAVGTPLTYESFTLYPICERAGQHCRAYQPRCPDDRRFSISSSFNLPHFNFQRFSALISPIILLFKVFRNSSKLIQFRLESFLCT